MTTDTHDQPGIDYEKLFKEAVGGDLISRVARRAGESVVARMFEARTDDATAELTKRIQEAAGQQNIEMILALTDELRQSQDREAERSKQLYKLTTNFSFIEVLKAFPVDYNELVYELGVLTMEHVEDELAKSKTRVRNGNPRERPPQPVYIITKGNHSIEAKKNVGAARLPSAEREFFEFLGFAISSDGRSTIPSNFKNVKDEIVSIVTKKTIIEDMLAGNLVWKHKGYKIELKEEAATSVKTA